MKKETLHQGSVNRGAFRKGGKKPKSLWGAPLPTIMTEDGELSLAEAARREREKAKE